MDVELIMDVWPVIVHARCRRGARCRPGARRHGGRRHCQFHGRGARHGPGACHGRGARQIKIDQRINVLYLFRIHK